MIPEVPNHNRTQAVPPFAGTPARDAAPVVPVPVPAQGTGLPVGYRLGEFEISRVLGEGSFSIAYLVKDHSLQRLVALEEYLPSALALRTQAPGVQLKSERHRAAFDAGLRSFVNEARMLALFDHPALLKVYRFWEGQGTAYRLMPHYEGTTLKLTLQTQFHQHRMAPDENWLRELLLPLCDALSLMHSGHCYHGDIEPGTVMLLGGSRQQPMLLDFGAARRVIGELTQSVTSILNPGYAPIEQHAEAPGMKQGPWTDVYALAAVMHAAITGRTAPPAVGRLLNDTYRPLTEQAKGRYSHGFLAAIDRALIVRPEERTQDIGALRADLGLDASGSDTHAAKPPTPDAGATLAPAPGRPEAGPSAPTAHSRATSSRQPGAARPSWLWPVVSAAVLAAVAIGIYFWRTTAP